MGERYSITGLIACALEWDNRINTSKYDCILERELEKNWNNKRNINYSSLKTFTICDSFKKRY